MNGTPSAIARIVSLLGALLIGIVVGLVPAAAQTVGATPETTALQCDSPEKALPVAFHTLVPQPEQIRPMSPLVAEPVWGRCPGNQRECHGGCIPAYASCCMGGGWCNAGSGGCCGNGCCSAGSYCAIVNGVQGCYRRY